MIEEKKMSQTNTISNTKFRDFMRRKNIVISTQRYFIDALSHMAMGLFASLLIGTILNSIGLKFHIRFFSETLFPLAKAMTGPAIAVAIAMGLQAPPLVVFSTCLVGALGDQLGGPIGSFVSVIFATEFGKMVSKETKIDIIVTPGVTILVGTLIAVIIGPALSKFMVEFGNIIMQATTLKPILMGAIVSALVGIALTLPISSAAICMMLGLGGLAGGAATVGCCAQMVGFAVMSYRENKLGGLVAQGIGTSMIQIPNIIKNWKIWIPPTLSSIILGPISTTVFKMTNVPLGSGMGTCGLVGQFGTFTSMLADGRDYSQIMVSVIILHFIAPAILTLLFGNILRKVGWIEEGDLKLDL